MAEVGTYRGKAIQALHGERGIKIADPHTCAIVYAILAVAEALERIACRHDYPRSAVPPCEPIGPCRKCGNP